MKEIVKEIRRELRRKGDERTRESGKRFFKERIRLYGVGSATVHRIAREHFRDIRDRSKKEVLDLCEELWKSGYIEESFIACDWSYRMRGDYGPRDLKVFERWILKYVSNWASCDTLCNHTIGAFVDRYPECISVLQRWARSKNRWMRRASAVSLIIPARQGKFLNEIRAIADILLLDRDDLVQKGYGWMLKAASQAHRKEIFDYIMCKKQIMPRTALRYAIEKMPKGLRMKAMKQQGKGAGIGRGGL